MSDKWTLEDMPNLSGKVIIVTGANSEYNLSDKCNLVQLMFGLI